MKRPLILIIVVLLSVNHGLLGQTNTADSIKSKNTYPGGTFYKVESIRHFRNCRKPRNIVLMIGDGMGVAQVFAGMTANGGHLYIDNFDRIGFSKTQPSKGYITDSAAGGTAIATGEKTYDGAVGVDTLKKPLENILEIVRKRGFSTGVVVTTEVTDATPASFVAHVPSRYQSEEIAQAFVDSGIDLFIGAGRENFENRNDGKNLIPELAAKGYKVCSSVDEINAVKSGKTGGFLENLPYDKRGDQLAVTTGAALRLLSRNGQGFFLMVEGSKIDSGGHATDMNQEVGEMLDFDRAVGKVLEFAAKDRRTLVVVTADHETGGLSLTGGDMSTGKVTGNFAWGNHTGIMVPVFAYGPGADAFMGIYENTGIFRRFLKVLKIRN
jgi:alkaline phosphatase